MNKCKDCFFYMKGKEDRYGRYPGICESGKFLEGGGYMRYEDLIDGLAYVYDEGDTTFYVGPEFGCVHFRKQT